jgi:succinate dehydrogenase/fumarate reductase-like Fe-S protein
MKIVLRVQRFLPGTDPAPYEQDYEVEVEPADRILDSTAHGSAPGRSR